MRKYLHLIAVIAMGLAIAGAYGAWLAEPVRAWYQPANPIGEAVVELGPFLLALLTAHWLIHRPSAKTPSE